ncbi:hypothetical protein WJX84_011893 [Apatococcus fuscideae]|uniref:Uncharacterized protein n=1 Tax=Apatococcus fuscideae TaxID=2026836 RepID=A0AAW1SR94_9CHLO
MADETVSTCSLPMPFSQPQQQHPLASLASSVKGVHSALAGRTRIPKAPKPVHKPALAADCNSQGQPPIFLGSSCKRPGLPATVGTSQSGKAATRAAGLIFASVPGASSVLRSAEEQPLLLLSDTVRHIFAGTAARTLAQAFIHPIDTIKTRLQVASPAQELESWRNNVRDHPLNVYIGKRRVVHTGNWLVKGPRDVYLGLTGAIVGTLPTSLVRHSQVTAM